MVNEQALREAFQQIKKEFQSIRREIDELNAKLTHANGHSPESLQELKEALSNLNYTEDDVIQSLERQVDIAHHAYHDNHQPTPHQEEKKYQLHPATKIKKNPIKEVDEFIEGGLDIDTDDLADEYY